MKFVAAIAALATVASAAPQSQDPVKLSQADAQARLEGAGIGVWSSGGCIDKNNPECTSYDGLNLSTVEGVINLKAACACAITITGGTETGHGTGGGYSHANGYKLDLHKDGPLNGYITSAFTRIADRGDGFPQWQAASGNIYCDEGNHWDIVYYTDGG